MLKFFAIVLSAPFFYLAYKIYANSTAWFDRDWEPELSQWGLAAHIQDESRFRASSRLFAFLPGLGGVLIVMLPYLPQELLAFTSDFRSTRELDFIFGCGLVFFPSFLAYLLLIRPNTYLEWIIVKPWTWWGVAVSVKDDSRFKTQARRFGILVGIIAILILLAFIRNVVGK